MGWLPNRNYSVKQNMDNRITIKKQYFTVAFSVAMACFSGAKTTFTFEKIKIIEKQHFLSISKKLNSFIEKTGLMLSRR